MNEHDPSLKVRFDGQAVGAGKIPVSHLLHFLSSMNKALQRTARVLKGNAESVRPGQPPKNVKQEAELDLVLLTHGSPAAVLGFERRQPAVMPLPGMDSGLEVLEKAISGLAKMQEITLEDPLPAGCDTGVLKAWREVGALFRQEVAKIEFTLRRPDALITTLFTPEGFGRIQERIQGPQTNRRTIEGRLLMADFKEYGTRCRVHPSVGDSVFCLFDEEQKEEVLDNILHYVRVVGEAKEDPVSGKIASIKVYDIERLEDREDEAADLLPQGTPVSQDFWESSQLDELAKFQNVERMADVRTLFGTWPGEEDDGFEAAIDELRHPGTKRDSGP